MILRDSDLSPVLLEFTVHFGSEFIGIIFIICHYYLNFYLFISSKIEQIESKNNHCLIVLPRCRYFSAKVQLFMEKCKKKQEKF